MVIVKLTTVPLQVPSVGVIETVEVIADVVVLVPTNGAMSVFPDEASPVAALLFVQLNVAPTVPLKLTAAVF